MLIDTEKIAPAPRNNSPLLYISNFLVGWQKQLCWVFVLAALFATYYCESTRFINAVQFWVSPNKYEAQATIESTFTAHYSDGMFETLILGFNYSFLLDRDRYYGTSFSKYEDYQAGDTVTVSFIDNAVKSSVLKECRYSYRGFFKATLSSIVLFVLLCITLYQYARSYKLNRLLRIGIATDGIEENQRRSTTASGDHCASKKIVYSVGENFYTTDFETVDYQEITSEEFTVLYEQGSPREAIVLEECPYAVKLNKEGGLKLESVWDFFHSLRSFILPMIATVWLLHQLFQVLCFYF